jgi:lipoyl-dependent peroxiredoxin
MTEINRKAGALWNGDLKSGNGLVSTESRALFEQPYNAQTRFEDKIGTNPEELVAAAHAACFNMAFAGTLKKNHYAPQMLGTNATCTLTSKNGDYEITHMQLHVRAEVPGIDNHTFQKLVKETDKHCPMSNLLRKGLKIEIDATLI